MTDTRIPTLDELRQWAREKLESQLASARFLAAHGTSARERSHNAKRVRRLREVLEGMDDGRHA